MLRQQECVLSAGTIIDNNARNSQGENLGKVEEIMLDLETDKVSYAVLSFGGFLGLGDKLFTRPDTTDRDCQLRLGRESAFLLQV